MTTTRGWRGQFFISVLACAVLVPLGLYQTMTSDSSPLGWFVLLVLAPVAFTVADGLVVWLVANRARGEDAEE